MVTTETTSGIPATTRIPVRVEAASPTTRPSTERAAGGSLLDEAVALLERQQWRSATKVALSAKRLRPDDIRVDAILAISGANSRRIRGTEAAIDNLRSSVDAPGRTNTDRAIGYSALAAVALADRDHQKADELARQAVELDPNMPDGWWNLSASYSGLGWFNEAMTCRNRAELWNGKTPLAEFNAGRAINHWAMSKVPLAAVTLAAVILFGFLGLAFGVTAPFLAREIRVSRLDKRERSLADQAWARDPAQRIMGASIVLAIIVVWLVTLAP